MFPHLIKGFQHISCKVLYFVPVHAYFTFQAESTETRTGGKPGWWLKNVGEKAYEEYRGRKGQNEKFLGGAIPKDTMNFHC